MEIKPKLATHSSVQTPEEEPRLRYIILAEKDFEPLANMVNEFIAKGWEPQGGIADTTGSFVSQAMVKRRAF